MVAHLVETETHLRRWDGCSSGSQVLDHKVQEALQECVQTYDAERMPAVQQGFDLVPLFNEVVSVSIFVLRLVLFGLSSPRLHGDAESLFALIVEIHQFL